jgi:hypothetical protein
VQRSRIDVEREPFAPRAFDGVFGAAAEAGGALAEAAPGSDLTPT